MDQHIQTLSELSVESWRFTASVLQTEQTLTLSLSFTHIPFLIFFYFLDAETNNKSTWTEEQQVWSLIYYHIKDGLQLNFC